jgi:spore coat protein CotH
VDIGLGLKYWGLYCGVEVPDDNMIKAQFGEESGNIYKPESSFTTFDPLKFEKKNNTTASDYSDVQQFVGRLNSSTRTTNPAQWRGDLEQVFNMNHFAKYLAVNNAIVNWDTYGMMAHNYYLYNHTQQKLCWIPWDNNESFTRNPGITGTAGGGGGLTALSLTMNEVGTGWPLIRYLAADPVYFQMYKDYLKTFNNTVFIQAYLDGLIDQYYTLITPYVIGTEGEKPGYTYLTSATSFQSEKQNLKTHVSNRRSLIQTFVP